MKATDDVFQEKLSKLTKQTINLLDFKTTDYVISAAADNLPSAHYFHYKLQVIWQQHLYIVI